MSKLQSQWPQYGVNLLLPTTLSFTQLTFEQLQSWQVVKMDASSGYSAMCLTYWKDTAGFTKAASVSAEIMADGPNYSATKPVLLVGSVLAASEK